MMWQFIAAIQKFKRSTPLMQPSPRATTGTFRHAETSWAPGYQANL